MRIQAFAMGLSLAWATVGGARADDVLFTISGGDTATFELALSPMMTPADPILPDYSFGILSVSAVIGGSRVTLPTLDFYSAELGGGGFFAKGFFNFSGPQFYTGPESSPTFIVPGVHLGLYNAATNKTDTVRVELVMGGDPPDPPTLAVPELSTWAMLLLGFLGLGYAGYRKARTRTIS
jgi:hypothetical protein